MDKLTDKEFIAAHVGRMVLNDAVVSFSDVAEHEFDEPVNLFGGWLHEGSATLLHGATGLGKSQFAMSVACCIAGGGSFAGWSAPSGTSAKVLYLDGEMGLPKVAGMMKRVAPFVGADHDKLKENLMFLPVPGVDQLDGFDLEQKGYQRLIMEYMDANDIELLVVDNVRTLVKMEDENSKEGWQALSDFVTELRTFATVLILHHDNKSGDFSGSGHAPTVMDYRIQLSEANTTHALRGCACAFTVDFCKIRPLPTEAHRSRTVGLHPAKGWVVQNDRATEFNMVHDAALSGRYGTQRALAEACGLTASKLNKLLTDFDPHGEVKALLEAVKRGDEQEPGEGCAGVDALLDP